MQDVSFRLKNESDKAADGTYAAEENDCREEMEGGSGLSPARFEVEIATSCSTLTVRQRASWHPCSG